MGQVNRNLHLAQQLTLKRLKSILFEPKAQSTDLVKQSKVKIKHAESGTQSSQSESLCVQDNADLQTTTKGDKSHHSTTQSMNFLVKTRCKYCDKPSNSITNHRKHLKVCGEAINDCKTCGKTFTSVKQYQNHKWSCTVKSHNCMICLKTFSHTDSLVAHVQLHYPCQKIHLSEVFCCLSDRKRFTNAYFTRTCSINWIND